MLFLGDNDNNGLNGNNNLNNNARFVGIGKLTLGIIEREKAATSLVGWLAYIVHADTYNYRKKLVAIFNSLLPASKNLATPFPTSRRSSV